MSIKEVFDLVMPTITKPTRQVELVKTMAEISKYSEESIRANVFRRKDYIPNLYTDYHKIKVSQKEVYWDKGGQPYVQVFKKPKKYYTFLKKLNVCNSIYTLVGTNGSCLEVLDTKKTFTVDNSPLINDADFKCDIFKIKMRPDDGVNLDFEGRLTPKKVRLINNLGCKLIVLTMRVSVNDDLNLSKLNYRLLESVKYKSGTHNMECVLMSL